MRLANSNLKFDIGKRGRSIVGHCISVPEHRFINFT
jgi:hypothetical protein